jgi:hypothetical protein
VSETNLQRTNRIVAMQQRIRNSYPLKFRDGCDDGFWGPRSIAACQLHLRSMMPAVNPWPAPDQMSLRKFYGEPGDESQLVFIEFPYPTFYDGKRVTRTRVHRKCAESLTGILKDIGTRYHGNRGILEEAEDYGGVFNFRPKRGGTSWSCHAYGAAIDLDADDNTFRDSWPMVADMPLEIMECFARKGWLSAGAFWGYDAMHFQATKG